MPHIVIEGKILNFESIHLCFTRLVERKNNYIIKLEDSFLNQSKDLILIHTTVIESDNTIQKYYIQLMKKENQVTVRLDPMTAPSNKNNGVKTSIAKAAHVVLSIHNESNNLSITKTNLQGFI